MTIRHRNLKFERKKKQKTENFSQYFVPTTTQIQQFDYIKNYGHKKRQILIYLIEAFSLISNWMNSSSKLEKPTAIPPRNLKLTTKKPHAVIRNG